MSYDFFKLVNIFIFHVIKKMFGLNQAIWIALVRSARCHLPQGYFGKIVHSNLVHEWFSEWLLQIGRQLTQIYNPIRRPHGHPGLKKSVTH